MYNRYQGNTGKVVRVDDGRERAQERPPLRPIQPRPYPSPRPQERGGGFGIMERLSKLLPGSSNEFETEDIILLMILYLMYRESGDSELLIIMGAMFLL